MALLLDVLEAVENSRERRFGGRIQRGVIHPNLLKGATAFYLLKKGRTHADAMREVDRILAWASVAGSGDAEARRARTLGFSDFEDALQAVAAEACRADCIVTRNTTDFSLSSVPALLPQKFLSLYPPPEAT